MSLSDLALAELLAEAAGQAIRPWFRRPFLVETKEDFSPVTIADREAEAAIRRLLEAEAAAACARGCSGHQAVGGTGFGQH